MGVHVIVGLKRLDDAKTRLAPAFDATERRALMRVMVLHVLDVARSSGVGPVWLATSEPTADALAAQAGVGAVDDGGLPWNEGLALARDAVTSAGDAVLYLCGDLPLLTAEDVRTLVATPAPVVVARARDGGSNAVLVRPASALTPNFGVPGSSEVHVRRASTAGLGVTVLDIPGFALDVDTADDLRDAQHAGAVFSGRGRAPAAG